MASTTTLTVQEQANEIDARITQLKDSIQESEAELNLLLIKERKASAAELPPLFRKKEILVSAVARDRAALSDATEKSAELWGVIRRDEEAARIAARTAEPLKLKAEVLAAIHEFETALASLSPQSATIRNGLAQQRLSDRLAIIHD